MSGQIAKAPFLILLDVHLVWHCWVTCPVHWLWFEYGLQCLKCWRLGHQDGNVEEGGTFKQEMIRSLRILPLEETDVLSHGTLVCSCKRVVIK